MKPPGEIREGEVSGGLDIVVPAFKTLNPELAQFFPWQHFRTMTPQRIRPFAAIWRPKLSRKGSEAESSSMVRGNEALNSLEERSGNVRRRLLPRLDLHKIISRVQQNVNSHLLGVRRQLSRYQQNFKLHRELKRSAKKESNKQKTDNVALSRNQGKYGAAIEDLMARALKYERELDVRKAIQCYEEIVQLLPNSYYHLALCSKAWSDATYLDEIHNQFKEPLTVQDKRDLNLKAKEYAEKALKLGSADSLPEVAACVSIGRLALFSDNKPKVALVKEAREYAVSAIAKEPGNDLAHHLMGRWHWEMAQLNVVVRTLIRIAFGTGLPSGTHADALLSYATACKLAPHRLIHRVELGRAYHKLGRKKEAWHELEAAILLDQEDINAYLQKIDADILLKGLRRDANRLGWTNETVAGEKMEPRNT